MLLLLYATSLMPLSSKFHATSLMAPSTKFHCVSMKLKDSVLTESANGADANGAEKVQVVLDSIEEEVGLTCPPLDDVDCMLATGIFFDLSAEEFFHGIHDQHKSTENAHKPSRTTNPLMQKVCPPGKGKEMRVLEALYKPNKKVYEDTAYGTKIENVNMTKRLPFDQVSLKSKFESTKRKLHESYEQYAKEKKRRRIQVIDLPKGPKSKLRREKHFKAFVTCQ